MQRTKSSSKRALSPAVFPEGPAPKIPQLDGTSFGKLEITPEREVAEPKRTKTPKMPAFLQLSEEQILDKYNALVKLEGARLAASSSEPEEGQWARLDPNPILDRYSNIHPWANNRVKLQVPEGFNDYINASPVTLTSTADKQKGAKLNSQCRYICMQGPKKETVDHVWHMIWHELASPDITSPAVVIMLSPTHETLPHAHDPRRKFEKCYQYFPKDETSPPLLINSTNNQQLPDDFKATVRFESREPGIEGTSIEVRKLIMTVEGQPEEKPIWHYLYPNWPDFGAVQADGIASIIHLMAATRAQNSTGKNPRLVHCSAGVGRTGTFIALEFLLGELQAGAWEGWDERKNAKADADADGAVTTTTAKATVGIDPVYETVNQLRMQRKTMVQADEQYAFLYEVLRKTWLEKYGGDDGEREREPKSELKHADDHEVDHEVDLEIEHGNGNGNGITNGNENGNV